MEKLLISYVRVSTQKQGRSGLGLEAQQAAISSFATGIGGRVLTEYREIETGKKNDRPELAKALNHAKHAGACLVVGKLDRLARNTRFLLTIIESGADVAFCDLPQVQPGPTGKFILTQFAAVAELEAGLISQRTRDGLAAAKARGAKLGSHRPGHWDGKEEARARALVKARKKAIENRKRRSEEYHRAACQRIVGLRMEGLSYEEIARRLNAQSFFTPQGAKWKYEYVWIFLQKCRSLHLITPAQKRAIFPGKGNAYRRLEKLRLNKVLPLVLEMRGDGKTIAEIAIVLNAEQAAGRQWRYRDVYALLRGRKRRTLRRSLREEVAPIILSMRAEGKALADIAEKLNDEGLRTALGRPWSKRSVWTLYHRYANGHVKENGHASTQNGNQTGSHSAAKEAE
jgi:DNA invertase Pin-like site-specific DNA recombinase